MQLIKLSRVDLSGTKGAPDRAVWVNPAMIVSIYQVVGQSYYSLRLAPGDADGSGFAVREGPEDILALVA